MKPDFEPVLASVVKIPGQTLVVADFVAAVQRVSKTAFALPVVAAAAIVLVVVVAAAAAAVEPTTDAAREPAPVAAL